MLLPPRVQPTDISHGPRAEEAPATCSRFLQPLHAWKRLQVSYYGGKYSIERVFALETYARTTSLSRVFMVCLGTPMPMITLVVLQELIPLQDPSEGWHANDGFWIRTIILAFVVGHTIIGQASYMVDGVEISAIRLVLLSACAATMFTVCAAAIIAYIIFPVPFFVLTMAPLFYLLLIIAVRFIVGRHIIPHKEDMIPEAVIFTVDFFNTLYVATCMQSVSSVIAITAISVTDLLQTCIMLYGLHRRTVWIRPRLHEATNNPSGTNCVLTLASSLCRDIGKFSRQDRHGIRIRSCLVHRISEINEIHLQSLENIPEQQIEGIASDVNDVGPSEGKVQLRTHRAATWSLRLLCSRKRKDSVMPVLPSATSERPKTIERSD
ncbi:hypothetical protein GN244_ATG10841 [Phytophthora infestans]|uniref:Transmembrane protein n=1 Tax=Phytophthora infestans TaxID=4787 RepID=A0A833SN08_PHYIN|nr:hypothetical protein GN244_ATG10841 [Phytophthora infestans]